MDERSRAMSAGGRGDRRAAHHLALFAVAALAVGCSRKKESLPAPIPAGPIVGVAVAATAPREVAPAHSSSTLDPVERWIEQLASTDPATRQAAALSLSLAGAAAHDAVAPLTDMLDDPNPRTRLLAAQALGRIGPDALPAVTRLEALAADETDVDVRAAATTALALLSVPLQAARGVTSPVQDVSPPASVMPRIDARDDAVRVQAMREATAFGTLAAPSVGDLVRNLHDDSPSIRREAATSLGIIGSHSPTRVGSVATIGRVLPPAAFGPEAENAIARLGDVVAEDQDPTVRLAAATALARIGAPAEAAQADLERAASQDADEAVRLAASRALSEIRRRY
jgi:HEAT repeat protein